MGMEHHEVIHYKYNLKVYWQLLRPHKALLILLGVVILIGELASLSEKFIFKAIVDSGTAVEAGQATREAFMAVIMLVLAIYIFASLARSASKWFFIHFLNRLDGSTMQALKRRYFDHIIELSHSFHTGSKTGSLISRITRGSNAMERLNDRLVFDFVPLLLRLILTLASLVYFDWMSAVICLVMSVVFVVYSLFINRLQKKSSVVANDTEDLEKAQLGDYLTNIESIKHFGKERSVMAKFGAFTSRTRQAMTKYWDYYRYLDAGHVLILTASTIAIMGVSVWEFVNGKTTIGTMVFVYTTFTGLVVPLFGFVNGIREAFKSLSDFESLFQYDHIQQEVKDKPGAKAIVIKKGGVRFEHLTFKYKQRPILKDFDLRIQPDTKVALVGPSGAGKSTVIRLLYRLYDAQEGSVSIDGFDVRDVKQESLRAELSIVPQECVLFDDSIYNNIAFSDPGASRKQVFAAIRFAQLDKLLAKLPKKEDTLVGERGIKLSGGEKQRVSIARALLADKKILVLDEATSSLDSETESEIQHDLKRLMQGRTTIIIAHRLSTIMHADVVVVMEKGTIVQMGTHNALIKQEGLYKRLWNLQKGGYIK